MLNSPTVYLLFIYLFICYYKYWRAGHALLLPLHGLQLLSRMDRQICWVRRVSRCHILQVQPWGLFKGKGEGQAIRPPFAYCVLEISAFGFSVSVSLLLHVNRIPGRNVPVKARPVFRGVGT